MFFPNGILGIGFQSKTDNLRCLTGSVSFPFSEMFADTCRAHGVEFARGFYTDRGMSPNEFNFWIKATKQV